MDFYIDSYMRFQTLFQKKKAHEIIKIKGN